MLQFIFFDKNGAIENQLHKVETKPGNKNARTYCQNLLGDEMMIEVNPDGNGHLQGQWCVRGNRFYFKDAEAAKAFAELHGYTILEQPPENWNGWLTEDGDINAWIKENASDDAMCDSNFVYFRSAHDAALYKLKFA